MAAIKDLRARTGAPITDCKNALNDPEVDGDLEKAFDWLRAKGAATFAKREGNVTAEGLIAVAWEEDQTAAAIVELNSETDFVARNADFIEVASSLASDALSAALEGENLDSVGFGLVACSVAGGSGGLTLLTHAFTRNHSYYCTQRLRRFQGYANVHASVAAASEGKVSDLVGKMREKIVLRRAEKISAAEGGIISTYVHNTLGPGCGSAAALVSLRHADNLDLRADESVEQELQQLGKKLAMHIVAAKPKFLSRDSVSAKDLEREKAVLETQARDEGKPEEIIAKMVS